MEPEETEPSKGKKFLKITLITIAVLGAIIAILSIIQVDVPQQESPTPSSVVIAPREILPRPLTDAEKVLIETRASRASSTPDILTKKQMIVMETRSTTTNIRAPLTADEKATLEKRISQ